MESAFPLLFGAVAAVAAVAAAAGIGSLRRSGDPVLRRLQPRGEDGVAAEGALRVRRVAEPLPAASGDDKVPRLRRRLGWAGLRGARAPQLFLLTKAVLAASGLFGFAAANATRAEPIRMGIVVALCIGAVGFFLPNLWLSGRISARQARIDRSLPDALDLLVTCVEAGLGLDGAMQRVSDEIALAHPILSGELRLAFLEVKAGISRSLAFRRLAERTGSQELRALAATLAQTELFGTSIGAALRTQAEGIRIRRMQRAEERAAYVSVKMSLPLVLCILPALLAVVVGPAIVNIVTHLLPMMGGGR